jgi:hypothetical protein
VIAAAVVFAVVYVAVVTLGTPWVWNAKERDGY